MPSPLTADTEQTDIRPGEDDPDRPDHIPGNEQRQRQGHQACGDAPAAFRHRQCDEDAEGDFDQKDESGKQELTPQGIVQAIVGEHLLEPFGTHEDALSRPENILDRVVDHRHERDDGAEGNDDENR